MKIVKGICRVITDLAIGVLLIFSLINFGPRIFGIHPYVVLSGSMEPAIKTGGVVFVDQRADAYAIHSGDIITYSMADGTPVTHRVVEETTATVTTKGDANDARDYHPVAREKIIGRVVLSVPYLGYAYVFLGNPIVLLVLGAVLILNLIILFCNPSTKDLSRNPLGGKNGEKKRKRSNGTGNSRKQNRKEGT